MHLCNILLVLSFMFIVAGCDTSSHKNETTAVKEARQNAVLKAAPQEDASDMDNTPVIKPWRSTHCCSPDNAEEVTTVTFVYEGTFTNATLKCNNWHTDGQNTHYPSAKFNQSGTTATTQVSLKAGTYDCNVEGDLPNGNIASLIHHVGPGSAHATYRKNHTLMVNGKKFPQHLDYSGAGWYINRISIKDDGSMSIIEPPYR